MGRISVYIPIFILSFFISCAQTSRDFPGQHYRTANAYDFSCMISVPANWFGLQIHNTAVIQAGDLENRLFLFVLRNSKLKYYHHPKMTLDEYSRTTSWYLIDNLADVVLGDTRQLTIHGMKAIQREIHGTAKDEKISYLHTSIEGKLDYYQIIAWASPEMFGNFRQLFKKITKSFQELNYQEVYPDNSDPVKSS